MSDTKLTIRFNLSVDRQTPAELVDFDRVLISFLKSLPPATRHRWILSAIRSASLSVLVGESPELKLPSENERHSFRHNSHVLRVMAQGEGLAGVLPPALAQDGRSALPPSQEQPSAQGVRAQVTQAEGGGDAPKQLSGKMASSGNPASEVSGDIVSIAPPHQEQEQERSEVSDRPLSPLKQRLKRL